MRKISFSQQHLFALLAVLFLSLIPAKAEASPKGQSLSPKLEDAMEKLNGKKCTSKKYWDRVECVRIGMRILGSGIGINDLDRCVPTQNSPRQIRRPFKKAMKRWGRSKNTVDFFAPELPWKNEKKPIGISGMEDCMAKKMQRRLDTIRVTNMVKGCKIDDNLPEVSETEARMLSGAKRVVGALKGASGREKKINYAFKWKDPAMQSICRPKVVQNIAGEPWKCENKRKFTSSQPRLKTARGNIPVHIPGEEDIARLSNEKRQVKDALKIIKKKNKDCKKSTRHTFGKVKEILTVLGEPRHGGPIEAVLLKLVSTQEKVMSRSNIEEMLKKAKAREKKLDEALLTAKDIRKADHERQVHIATDLARICYNQAIGIWGLTVKFGSELDHLMARKDSGNKASSDLRMLHACDLTIKKMGEFNARDRLKRSPGDKFPANLSIKMLETRLKKLKRKTDKKNIVQAGKACFSKPSSNKKPTEQTLNQLRQQLNYCDDAIQYFANNKKVTRLPKLNKTKAQVKKRREKIKKIMSNVRLALQKSNKKGECAEMWTTTAQKYKKLRRKEWMSCCTDYLSGMPPQMKSVRSKLIKKCAR